MTMLHKLDPTTKEQWWGEEQFGMGTENWFHIDPAESLINSFYQHRQVFWQLCIDVKQAVMCNKSGNIFLQDGRKLQERHVFDTPHQWG